MRIMKVISSLHYGGAETQVINLSKELVRQGHQVMLVSLSQDVPRLSELNGSKVDVIVENKKSKVDFSLILRLRALIRQWQPDVLHGYLYDAEFYCRLAALGMNVPVINSERNDNYVPNKLQKIGDLLTTWMVDGVIANSCAGMAFARKRYRFLLENRFKVLWNGIDMDLVRHKVLQCENEYKSLIFDDPNIKLACMVASIKEQKDYRLALEVADQLIETEPSWRVIFLGDKLAESDDSYKSEILSKYNQLKNREKIRFLGNRSDVVEILSQCDVAFLTSHYEGFPNAVLESMAVGTPVVTTEFSDIKRITVADYLILDDRDPARFVRVILIAMANRENLKLKSSQWVIENCSLPAVAEKLVEIYAGFLISSIN